MTRWQDWIDAFGDGRWPVEWAIVIDTFREPAFAGFVAALAVAGWLFIRRRR